jgi:opacity protein-like surface antigen
MAPAVARADGMIIPFAGVNFGGKSGSELADAINAKRFDWGVSFAFMGAGVLGLEADLGYSPDFFGRSDIGGSSVLTVMGNLLIGIPIGGQKGVGFRPYVLAGAGVVRPKVDVLGDAFSFNNSEAAWDFGGGAMFFFGDNIGLRGDIRYFRTFESLDFGLLNVVDRRQHLDFARGSAGLILRF